MTWKHMEYHVQYRTRTLVTKCSWQIKHLRTGPATQSQYPAKFSSNKACESKNILFFKLPRYLKFVTWSKGYLALIVVTFFHGKSEPWLVLCPWDIFNWRYDVFNLSRELKSPHNWGVIQIFRWDLLVWWP